MRSLGVKITVIMMAIVMAIVITMSLISVYFIRKTEHRRSDQIMLLLCETGERNLDYYFNGIQRSVNNLSTYVENDIDGLDDDRFSLHMERVKTAFAETAAKTNGVLTYYYRIDPEVSQHVKGFWYTNVDGKGFTEHEVTDITLYDTADTSALVWFTTPKHEGKAIWLPPYVTENLDMRVISYNVPIFWHGKFVGVVGFEMDYSTMAEQVDEKTWKLRVEQLQMDEGQVPEAIEDGIRYVTVEPYGLSEGDVMILYGPGTPVSVLSEEMQLWAHIQDQEEQQTELENWFLSSEANDSGFVGYQPVLLGDP